MSREWSEIFIPVKFEIKSKDISRIPISTTNIWIISTSIRMPNIYLFEWINQVASISSLLNSYKLLLPMSFPRWKPGHHIHSRQETPAELIFHLKKCMWIHGTGIVDPAFTIKNHTNIWVNITYMDALATIFLLLYAIYIVYVVSWCHAHITNWTTN